MSPARFRPDIRVPWQALALFAALLYVLRSAVRGWDFRPSLLDFLVWGGFAALLVARVVFAARTGDGDGDREDPPPEE